MPQEPGLYMYDVAETRSGSNRHFTHTDQVMPWHETRSGEFRQVTWHLQEQGRPYFVESLWRPEGVRLTSRWFLTSGPCYWSPPLFTPLPVEIGKSWTDDAVCANDPGVRLTETTNALRGETLTVAGENVETLVLQTLLRLRGRYNLEQTNMVWWSDRYRFDLRTDIQTGSTGYLYSEVIKAWPGHDG